ncbi:MAG: hypothetical protein ACNYNY_00105 [Candidatus Oxydemutatoraceae bacterium WSBS_2016_MAG_OTU14]
MKMQGFTVLEVLTALILLSLISLFFWVPEMEARVRDLHRTRATIAVEEMHRLGVAAQLYSLDNNGDWPDLDNQCVDSLDALSSGRIDAQSPFYTGAVLNNDNLPERFQQQKRVRVGEYTFSCPDQEGQLGAPREWLVRLVLAGNDKAWAAYIANQFAGAQHTPLDEYAVVEVSTLQPSSIPALDAYLPRDGSASMQGDLNMGRYDIHQAAEVMLDTGQTLGSVPVLHAVTRPGNHVLKPTCPPHYQALIFVTPQSIAHKDGFPITRFRVWASDEGTTWQIHSEVFGTSTMPDQNNHNKVLVQTLVKCAI